jgi:hypothetical protein
MWEPKKDNIWKVSKEYGRYTLKMKKVLSWQQISDIEKIIAQEDSRQKKHIKVKVPPSIEELLESLESMTFNTVGWRGHEGYALNEVDDFLDLFRVRLIRSLKDLGQITEETEQPTQQLKGSDKPQIVQKLLTKSQSAETQPESTADTKIENIKKGATDGNNN